MSFLSSESIEKRLEKTSVISEYNPERIKHSAYELSLGNAYFVTDNKKKETVDYGEHIVIKPGQFALLITKEKISIPKDLLGFISIKAGIKFRGLINVSGFHVDPGFNGKIKFSVYNAGSKDIVLSAGDPTFLIWFAKLDEKTKNGYNGIHQDQNDISTTDVMKIQGEMASPNELQKRIDKLETKQNILLTISASIFIALIILLFSDFRIDIDSNTNELPEEVNVIESDSGSVSNDD